MRRIATYLLTPWAFGAECYHHESLYILCQHNRVPCDVKTVAGFGRGVFLADEAHCNQRPRWFCDQCGARPQAGAARFRCSVGCDWDCCGTCFEAGTTSQPREWTGSWSEAKTGGGSGLQASGGEVDVAELLKRIDVHGSRAR